MTVEMFFIDSQCVTVEKAILDSSCLTLYIIDVEQRHGKAVM